MLIYIINTKYTSFINIELSFLINIPSDDCIGHTYKITKEEVF
jgi:hypothetical protein